MYRATLLISTSPFCCIRSYNQLIVEEWHLRGKDTLSGETTQSNLFYLLPKRGLLYQERICSQRSKFFHFRLDSVSEGFKCTKKHTESLNVVFHVKDGRKCTNVSSPLKYCHHSISNNATVCNKRFKCEFWSICTCIFVKTNKEQNWTVSTSRMKNLKLLQTALTAFFGDFRLLSQSPHFLINFSNLFIIVINLIFMFSLWCIDWVGSLYANRIFMYFCIKSSITTQGEVS